MKKGLLHIDPHESFHVNNEEFFLNHDYDLIKDDKQWTILATNQTGSIFRWVMNFNITHTTDKKPRLIVCSIFAFFSKIENPEILEKFFKNSTFHVISLLLVFLLSFDRKLSVDYRVLVWNFQLAIISNKNNLCFNNPTAS